MGEMNAEEFREALAGHFDRFTDALATDTGDWVVKGFIDVYRRIYTISIDTKVVSKIIELMLFPIISLFAEEHGFRLVLSEHQNYYPDISFLAPDDSKSALDLKSTYRKTRHSVNGFTLGSFTGYFRQRASKKNITFPYGEYSGHFILGTIYSRVDGVIDERRVYTIDNLQSIVSVIGDFTFLLQEKWRIAGERPGSGNTRNIGSIRSIRGLVDGNGPFASHGPDVFDDYWMNYLTPDMARAIDSPVPYRNLDEYWQWRDRTKRRPSSASQE